MAEFKLENYIDEIYKTMRSSGLFLTGGNNPPTTTSFSWGLIGNLWNRPVFIVPVRETKHTFKTVKETGFFTVSVPRKDLMTEILRASAASGIEQESFSELHLHPVKARHIDTYIVSDGGLHLECKTIYRSQIVPDNLDLEIKEEMYNGHSYHTIICGEIIDIYEY